MQVVWWACLVSLQRSLKVHAPQVLMIDVWPRRLACTVQAFRQSFVHAAMLTTLCAIERRASRTRTASYLHHCPTHTHTHINITTSSRAFRQHLLAPGTSAACFSSAASRFPTMTQMAHLASARTPPGLSYWTSQTFETLSAKPLWLCVVSARAPP